MSKLRVWWLFRKLQTWFEYFWNMRTIQKRNHIPTSIPSTYSWIPTAIKLPSLQEALNFLIATPNKVIYTSVELKKVKERSSQSFIKILPIRNKWFLLKDTEKTKNSDPILCLMDTLTNQPESGDPHHPFQISIHSHFWIIKPLKSRNVKQSSPFLSTTTKLKSNLILLYFQIQQSRS